MCRGGYFSPRWSVSSYVPPHEAPKSFVASPLAPTKPWWRPTFRQPTFTPSWELPADLAVRTQIIWPAEYGWGPAKKWLDPIKKGLAKHTSLRTNADVTPLKHAAMVFHLEVDGERYPVAIDYSDYPEIDEPTAKSCLAYFKMQFRGEGYGSANVYPGGFVTNELGIYRMLPGLRRRRAKNPKFEAYGRFTMRYGTAVRKKALGMLADQDKFSFTGSPKILRYDRSLREAASAKVCIDLPGRGDLCFRLMDYLAMGCCVVGPRPNTKLPVPLEDRKHVLFAKPDLSDFVERCEECLEDEDLRNTLSANAQDYFDKYVHHRQLAAYYLHHCFELIS